MIERKPFIRKCLSSLPPSIWTMPILFKNEKLPFILPLLKKHTFSVYGSPEIKWNCGRRGIENISREQIKLSIDQFCSLGISCFTTFSNYFITPEYLDDAVGNYILELLSEYDNNGVIVSSDVLFNYIKTNYPRLKLKCSILKSSYENYTHNLDWYKRMLDQFDIVVLNPDLPVEYFDKLPDKDRIEILVNETCRKNCPNKRLCYLPDMDMSLCNKDCDHNGDNVLSIDLVKMFYDIGFRHFKVQGR